MAALIESSDYAGLTCVAWEAQGSGKLRVDVLNMTAPCMVEIEWLPRIEYVDGELRVIVSAEPECRLAGCGACTYDFAFELNDIEPSAPLPFRLWPEICMKTDESPEIELTLPLDQATQGIRCRPLPSVSLGFVGITGTAHGPCSHDDARCDPDLVCQEGVCLTQCTSDEDCPLSDVEVCEMNRCVVPASF